MEKLALTSKFQAKQGFFITFASLWALIAFSGSEKDAKKFYVEEIGIKKSTFMRSKEANVCSCFKKMQIY